MSIERRVVEAFLQRSCFHLQQDFLPKIHRCVEKLSDEDLWWRPNRNSNSVANLVLHLAGNVRQWIISGLAREEDRRQRQLEFSTTSGARRDTLLNQLDSAVAEAVAVIENSAIDDLLEKREIQVYKVTGVEVIIHVVEHFSYHTGQIIYITKLLKDTDLTFYNL